MSWWDDIQETLGIKPKPRGTEEEQLKALEDKVTAAEKHAENVKKARDLRGRLEKAQLAGGIKPSSSLTPKRVFIYLVLFVLLITILRLFKVC